jgi:aryl-alcohol dehydrogenase-like predicted oxidoreductase
MFTKKLFGRTGHASTRILFGAAAFYNRSQADADATMELVIQSGINHIDTAASYGDSELRLGPWIKRYRAQFFLASKTEERTRQGAWDSLRRSLDLLNTDHLDLLQLHSLSDPQEWAIALGPGGALEAFVEARQQGLIRFIGITGHGVQIARMHYEALQRFDFDSVLLPYNYSMMQNPQYAADFNQLLALCKERNVAFQTIKSLARANWGEQPHKRDTWYEPLEAQEDIDLAVHWVLGNPDIFLNSTGDINILPRVLDAANRFTTRPSDEAMQALMERTSMQPLFV